MKREHQFHVIDTGHGQVQVCKHCGIDAWDFQNPGQLRPGSVIGWSPRSLFEAYCPQFANFRPGQQQ